MRNYRRIALAYAALSTKNTSENLLLKIAEEQNKKIEIQDCDCTNRRPIKEKNDFENYGLHIAKEIQKIEWELDVVFLAQASMESALPYLNTYAKKVFSSPEFGIKSFLHTFGLI